MGTILIILYLLIGVSYATKTVSPEEMMELEYPWIEFTALILLWLPLSLIHGAKALYGKIREFLIMKGII